MLKLKMEINLEILVIIFKKILTQCKIPNQAFLLNEYFYSIDLWQSEHTDDRREPQSK